MLTRLDLGLPAEAVPVSTIGFPLTRGEILALFSAGHLSREAIAALAADVVAAIIGRRGPELHATCNRSLMLEESSLYRNWL